MRGVRGVICQLNISKGGMPKTPILQGEATAAGLAGDVQRNRRYHGGPEKALLLVTQGSLDELVALGYPVYPGAMGENLTVTGLDRRELRSGQRFRAGDAVIELTTLRQPCRHLDVYGPGIQRAVYQKNGSPGTGPWAMAGFYCRVSHPGFISTGDIIELIDHAV